MKRTLTITLFSLLLGLAVASNRALVVNLSAHQDASLDLPGNVHNVGLATDVAGVLGFQQRDIEVLQNQQVSREGVLDLLQGWSKQDVQPPERVLVYLAGRGTRVAVQNPDGKSTCQDALVLHNQEVLPIEEVRSLLQQMPAREVMLVIDSSFHDPLRRAVGVVSMENQQPRSQSLAGQAPCNTAPEKPQVVSRPDPQKQVYLELNAAGPQQISWSTAHGGLFSRTLAEVLGQNPGITFGELQTRVNSLMYRFTEQHGLPAQSHTLVLPAGWHTQNVRNFGTLSRTPTLKGTLKGHTDAVQAVAFHPMGNLLAYAVDRYVFLAEASTGKILRVLGGHTGTVLSVVFSPDGRQVLTGSADHTARLWDVGTGTVLRTFTGHRQAVDAVAFSPDGKKVVTGSRDKTARLWNADSGAPLKTFSGHDSLVFSVAFSPDGKKILTASDYVAQLWDTDSGTRLQNLTGHTSFVSAVGFSPDGKQILTGSHDQTVQLWDANTGQSLGTFTGHTGPVFAVAFSPDGQRILSGSQDQRVRLWDAQTGQPLKTLTGHTGAVFSVGFSPDGKQVLTGSADHTAQLWDADTGTSIRTFTGHRSSVDALALSPDGKHLVTGHGNTAQLWDARTGAPLSTLNGHTDRISSVGFSPDGKQVLTGGDHTLRLWDTRTGNLLKTFSGHADLVSSVGFSPDGKFILSGSKDTTARLWSVQTLETLKIFSGHKQPITSVKFSPDGKQVLTGSADHTARLWSVSTGETLKVFTGHTRPVRAVDFTPDGKQVLTSSEDRTLRVWSAQTGQQVAAYGVSSPHFRVGEDGTVLAHQDCMSLQHLQLSSGEVLREPSLGEGCFGDFTVSADGRTLVTDTGQPTDASTLSVFGFAEAWQGFFQQKATSTAASFSSTAAPVQMAVPAKTIEKRVALVIGNAAYQHASVLANPLRDAKLIETQLKQAGFEVVVASNVTRTHFDQAIRRFRQVLSGADVALLYYSGHGIQVSGVNHMVPVDAQLKSLQDVDFETVSVDFVMQQMDQENVGTKLIILDACRTNPFLKNTRSPTSDGLAPMKASRGSLIAFATAPGMPAADGSGQNSPYAKALGKHMLTPGLTVEQVFKRVRQDVLNETAGTQEPWENSSLLTDLYFVQ